MAQLNALRNNAQLQEAINVRQAARLLGVAPIEDPDGDLAGRDVIHNKGNAGPWVFAAVVLAAAIWFTWFWSQRTQAEKAAQPVTSATPAPGKSAPNSDYIEFYKP